MFQHMSNWEIYFLIKIFLIKQQIIMKKLINNPEKEFLFSNFLLTKTKMCDWKNLDKNLEKLRLNISKDKKVSTPYSNLIFFDDPEIHLKASKIWADEHLDEKKIGKIKIDKI